MTRTDLIAAIASRFPTLTAKDADIAIKEILDAIELSLAQGDRVEIGGFGSFRQNYNPARNSRNPKTGAAVPVPAKHVPPFRGWQGTTGTRTSVSQGRTTSAGRLMHAFGRIEGTCSGSRFGRRVR